MKKEVKIILEEGKITFSPSEDVTNSDMLVLCVNMFELVKENMEKSVPHKNQVSLEEFINTVCKALRKKEDKNGKQN